MTFAAWGAILPGVRIALAQINTTIGDFEGNLERIRASVERARAEGADLCVLPELALCGYPPMDLLERKSFLVDQQRALDALAELARGIAVVTGAVVPAPPGGRRKLANAAVALADGQVVHVQAKTLLPTYDVFDEARHFEPAREQVPWRYRGRAIGLTICEDVWSGAFWADERPYQTDPVAELVAAGAELIVTVSASPWEQGKIELREQMMSHAARHQGVPLVFCNLVGGNDGLVFDGSSMAASADGRVVERLARFAEDFAVVDPFADGEAPGIEPRVELLERALVLGIRDYLHKLELSKAVIALSGGIDSAVTAHLAALALGPENVKVILYRD